MASALDSISELDDPFSPRTQNAPAAISESGRGNLWEASVDGWFRQLQPFRGHLPEHGGGFGSVATFASCKQWVAKLTYRSRSSIDRSAIIPSGLDVRSAAKEFETNFLDDFADVVRACPPRAAINVFGSSRNSQTLNQRRVAESRAAARSLQTQSL